MTRKTRLILFLSLLILFLIAAPLAVFYSLGWRFNWEEKKISQPGVFYFKIQPRGAKVYLNGKLKEKSDIFFNYVFIENLFPKKYEVKIKKNNYHTWKKTLEIKKGEVTEGKNIVLIPQNVSFVPLSVPPSAGLEEKINVNETASLYSLLKEKEIIAEQEALTLEQQIKKINIEIVSKAFEEISKSFENFKLSPDFKKLAYFNEHEIWILFLNKKYDQPQKEAGDKIFLTRFSEKIDNLFWLTNHYLIFNTGNQIKVSEIDDRDTINIVTLTEKFPSARSGTEIFWDIKTKKLYVLSQETIYVSEKLIP